MNEETSNKHNQVPGSNSDEPETDPTLPNPTSHTTVGSEEDGDPIIWAKDIPPPGEGETVEGYWGPFIFPGSIQTLAGEPGIGKTTLLYNVVVNLAEGKPFAGITPAASIKVLYYDLETPLLLRKHKLHYITDGNPPAGLAFATSFTFEGARRNIKKYGFQLVVIDTINEAFDTHEEKDNAEANRQMQDVRKHLIESSDVSVILVGHMGKTPSATGVHKLRGASARVGAADVVMNLESKTADIISLQVEKSRWLGGKDKLFFKKIGEDQFDPIDMPGEFSVTTETKIQGIIASAVPLKPGTAETGEILSKAEAAGCNRGTTEKVLSKMAQWNVQGIERVKKGLYTRNPIIRPDNGIAKSVPEVLREVRMPLPPHRHNDA